MSDREIRSTHLLPRRPVDATSGVLDETGQEPAVVEAEQAGPVTNRYAWSGRMRATGDVVETVIPRRRWRDVDLLDGVLKVRESKSEAGRGRSIALAPLPRDALVGHYQRTAYRGDGERVFCHPERGSVYRAETFK